MTKKGHVHVLRIIITVCTSSPSTEIPKSEMSSDDVSKWRTPKYCGLSRQTSRIFKVLQFWDEGFSWGLSPLKNPHQIPQNCSALLPELNVQISWLYSLWACFYDMMQPKQFSATDSFEADGPAFLSMEAVASTIITQKWHNRSDKVG